MKIFQKLRAVEQTPKAKRLALATDTNSKFVYSNGSDVMKTWKRFGFIPPSEVRNDFLFKKNREMSDE